MVNVILLSHIRWFDKGQCKGFTYISEDSSESEVQKVQYVTDCGRLGQSQHMTPHSQHDAVSSSAPVKSKNSPQSVARLIINTYNVRSCM